MKRILVAATVIGLALVSPSFADECWSRVYTAEHLAHHPDQLVTRVGLRLYPAPPDASYRTFFKLSFALRGRTDTLHTGGYCVGNRCNVECDGGGITFDKHTGLMRLDRIRVATCADDAVEGGEEITGGIDDRVFRLDRVPCR